MRINEFRLWLMGKYFDSKTTVQNRISNCKNVEYYYGDLDSHYEKDKCLQILDELTYSIDDERAGVHQKHKVTINGNIRNGSATLKQSVKLYVAFRDDDLEINNEIFNPCIENIDEHDALISIIKGFKYCKKTHKDILMLQNDLVYYLNENYSKFVWETEFKASNLHKDSVDIFGKADNTEYIHVIELDTHRADQIAKKFVSRMALFEKSNVCYTAICYPGTKNMPVNEVKKYFDYCSIIAQNLSTKSIKSFKGLFINKLN